MATAAERHSVTEAYLTEIKSRMGICPMLEENDMKMLHMNAPLGGWREWRTLTYDHNVLADWLARENEELRMLKEDLKKKITMLLTPGYPSLSPWPSPLLIEAGVRAKSIEVEMQQKECDPVEEH